MPALTRMRRVRLKFVDSYGALIQNLVTSNGLVCHRDEYDFLREDEFTVVWCLNPQFKHYRGCRETLEASTRLFVR
jgi:hypothetical protein